MTNIPQPRQNLNGATPKSKRKPRTSPIPIQPAMCGSCIFREDGNQTELRPGRLDAIRLYTIEGVPHQCHHPQIHGSKKEVGCRGARDYMLQMWYRMGRIPAPTDEALETERLRHLAMAETAKGDSA